LGFFILGGEKMLRVSNLRMARIKAGKSQWDVAIETGIPQAYLSLYERGYRKPKPEHLKTLSRFYGVEVGELREKGEDGRT
jgi:transcriptional regulator with XRE-family HTH domain